MTQTKNRYSKPKFLATFGITILLLSGISHLFGLSTLEPDATGLQAVVETAYTDSPQTVSEEETATLLAPDDDTDDDILAADDDILAADDGDDSTAFASADSCPTGLAADGVFTSTKVWSYPACFPDSNALQLSAARLNGVAPMNSRNEVLASTARQQLSNISSSPYYVMDDLTHSMPYLVPKAQRLLNTIGINFVDSLHSKGMTLHLPIVTSVLRTTDDIRRLQHGNSNSVTNSCHCYGTTIDITYNRFMPIDGTTPTRFDDNLKKVLAEVLFDLRANGRCYVKYERKQACFHLTIHPHTPPCDTSFSWPTTAPTTTAGRFSPMPTPSKSGCHTACRCCCAVPPR